MTSIVMKVFAVLDPLMGRVSLSANAGEPPALTEDQWIDLAQRHANADWNSGRPNGFLNAVKALCLDYSATPTAQAEGWRPIETAPRDGTGVLANTAGLGRVVAYWHDEESQWGTGLGYLDRDAPTHWMPIPLPPASAEGVEHG